jgi:hypothetical protein
MSKTFYKKIDKNFVHGRGPGDPPPPLPPYPLPLLFVLPRRGPATPTCSSGARSSRAASLHLQTQTQKWRLVPYSPKVVLVRLVARTSDAIIAATEVAEARQLPDRIWKG